ncbi:tyrosine-type recombinase/integrase [Methylomonas sp. UP202]|uniref:tyrosine-type recombinase/integrase n=1 Tax=Methylomonas sp. UP202 TaxID=3040943 RepID=UPI0032AFE712
MEGPVPARGQAQRAGIPTRTGHPYMRHSFASHFVMNGGNVLSLQKILGHADISMTMRYAHLAPDHLKDAVLLNPMSNSSTNHPARGHSQVA